MKIFKKIPILCITILMLFVGVFSTTSTVSAANTNKYVAIVLLDTSQKRIVTNIYEDDSAGLVTKYLGSTQSRYRASLLGYSGSSSENEDFTLTDMSDYSQDHSYGSDYGATYLEFPGVSYSSTEDGTQNDLNQATNVMSHLTRDFNSAISFVLQYGTRTSSSTWSESENFAQLVIDIANAASSGGSVYGVTFTTGTASNLADFNIDIGEDGEISSYLTGLDYSDYVILTSPDGTQQLVVNYSLPKGYSEGQALYDADSDSSETNSHITWKGMAWYALLGYSKGLTSDGGGFDRFNSSSDFSDTINDWLSSIVNGITSFLGLSSYEELMFNSNSRGVEYLMGMMPRTWFSVSSIFYWISQIIAVLVLFAAVIRLLIKRNLSLVSPTQRASLKEGIVDIGIAIALLALYIPIFYVLARTNELIVNVFYSMTGGNTLVSSTGAGYNIILNIILLVVNLVMIIKLNLEYLVRAATLTITHILAPIAISSLALGPKARGFFNTWFKELIVNLFLQSMNAVVLSFFIVVTTQGRTSTWEGIAMLFMFIPLNRWFKDKLLGFHGAGGDAVAKETGDKLQGAGFTAVAPLATLGKNMIKGSSGDNADTKTSHNNNSGTSEQNENSNTHDINSSNSNNDSNTTPQRGGFLTQKVSDIKQSASTWVNEHPKIKSGLSVAGSIGGAVYNTAKGVALTAGAMAVGVGASMAGKESLPFIRNLTSNDTIAQKTINSFKAAGQNVKSITGNKEQNPSTTTETSSNNESNNSRQNSNSRQSGGGSGNVNNNVNSNINSNNNSNNNNNNRNNNNGNNMSDGRTHSKRRTNTTGGNA